MKTILVPTDFSECATNALRFAAFLAKKTGASINLLHVLEVPSIGAQGSIEYTADDVPYMMGLLKATKTRMKKVLSYHFMRDINVVQNIETGAILDHILKAAEKHNADLIVMGTHGTNGLEEILIGSNAEKVSRDAKIPVLTIKDGIKDPKLDKIVYATDFSDESQLMFPKLENLATLLGAEIEIVKIITKSEFESSTQSEQAMVRFKKLFKQPYHKTSIYCDYNKQSGIRNFARSVNAGIIALGTHGRHGISHFFSRGLTEDLVNHSSLPVLTLNVQENQPEKSRVSKRERKFGADLGKIYFSTQIPAI